MASPSAPTHGKLADVYRLRPNGFNGQGLNDMTWGTGFSGAATADYEVEIDAEATPDTFQWRKNGGGYTTGVAITGAAQTLDDGQTITFVATTGHEVGDRWSIGNFKDELCTESGSQAQITDSTKRILNPNNPPTFTDDGGEVVIQSLDFVRGIAQFSDNVGNVDVDGNNGFVLVANLEQVGYLVGWEFEWITELTDISRCQQQWKENLVGMGHGSGASDAYFIAGDSWFDALSDQVDGTQGYHFLELYNYEPDGDQTGDHFNAWVSFTSVKEIATRDAVIREPAEFTLHGYPSFIANT